MRCRVWLPLLIAAISGSSSAQEPAAPAVPVTTVVARLEPVAQTMGFVGRIQAVERVSVIARVTGYLEAILFKEGDLVKEGQPLYRIEQGLFKAAVEQAEGALQGSKASKKLAMVELDRANQLLATTYGTPQKRDQAVAADENAAAAILTSEANLDNGENQSWLHRHQIADHGPDRPDEHHEGQRRLSQQRCLDNRCQSRPDVRPLPGQPARVP